VDVKGVGQFSGKVWDWIREVSVFAYLVKE
jgi:hypothetical protein